MTGILLFALGACGSLEQVAPAVTPAMVGVAPGVSLAVLEAGRRTFATNCTACHGADPVTKYSPAEWREIIAEMGPRAKLDEVAQSALLAYIVAAGGRAAPAPAP